MDELEKNQIKEMVKNMNDQQKKVFYEQKKKNEIVAAVLSFLITGVGQMYCGEIKRGVIFLAAMFILAIIGTLILFFANVLLATTLGPVGTLVGLGITGIFALIMFGLWVYNIYDAYKTAKQFNEDLYLIIFNKEI